MEIKNGSNTRKAKRKDLFAELNEIEQIENDIQNKPRKELDFPLENTAKLNNIVNQIINEESS